MILLVLIFCCNIFTALYAHHSANSGDELSSRVLYGAAANIKDFPYFAGLSNCGAAIISDRWLLTAAHCFDHIKERKHENIVWVGGTSFRSSLRYKYDKVVIHPQYTNSDIVLNDIALLRLTRQLTFSSTVKAVPLPQREYTTNAIHAFVGRGKDETGKLSKNLMTMNVRTVGEEECLSHLDRWIKNQFVSSSGHIKATVKNVTICTKRIEDLPGLCFGDSGSPLVRDSTLVGLASFISASSCYRAKLGIFVNVAPFVTWIKSVTGIE